MKHITAVLLTFLLYLTPAPGAAQRSSAQLSSTAPTSAAPSSANLSSADLSSADLSSADLSSADLSSADLSSADLALTPDDSKARLSPAIADDVEGIPTTTVDIDVTGIEHFDGFDDPSNVVLTELVGAGAVMTGLGWDITITTMGSSLLSDAIVYIDGADFDGSGLFLIPGGGDPFPGTGTYDSGGIVDLTDNGIPNIPVLPDGGLYLQFYEIFDDFPNAADSVYEPGSTYTLALAGVSPSAVGIPTLSMFGLSLLFAALAGGGLILLRSR